MAISRPSRVGELSRQYPSRDDLERAEEAKTDRKLAQLEKAREAKEDKRLRVKEEAIRKEWRRLRRDLHLSRRQESLLAAVKKPSPFNKFSFKDVIRTVYGVEWDCLSEKQRFKYRGRLRSLQHALNLKLSTKSYSHRIASRRGAISLIRSKDWKRRLGVRRFPRLATAELNGKGGRQTAVTRCAEWLRLRFRMLVKTGSHFKDGWIPVTMLKEDARRAGFCLSTFKNARKRLGLQKRNVGFGDKGGWEVHLPRIRIGVRPAEPVSNGKPVAKPGRKRGRESFRINEV